MGSFTEIGEFVPLSWDRQGNPTREVASARYSLPLPDHPDRHLDMGVTLVRDLRRRVPSKSPSGEGNPSGDAYLESPSWLDDEWVPSPSPAAPTEPALVPIVTTATEINAVELAQTYIRRWPAQENVIRDWLLRLGLDTNHGYSKAPVRNSEVEKKRAALEKRLGNAKRWGEQARLASLRAHKTSDRRWKRAKARSREAYSELNRELSDLEAKGAPEREYRARERELVDAVEAEMEGYWRGYYRSHDTCNSEYAKWQAYCREQREILRELEDLKAGEMQMYELDDRKDQVMTALKLGFANLAMWVRDNYFPPEYARATWQRLAPFFRLPGRVSSGEHLVLIELRSFNDRRLNRDLATVAIRLDDTRAQISDGRRVRLSAAGMPNPILHTRELSVA